MKHFIFVLIWGSLSLSLQAKEITRISAEIQGYTEKTVYFGFAENPELQLEFPYIENQVMEFNVELEDITMMAVNNWIKVCLQPGEQIHLKIVYKGKNYQSVEFTGSPSAVTAGQILHQIREMRRERKYGTDIPTALLNGNDPKTYFSATHQEWEDESILLNKVKNQLPLPLYYYLLSEVEGTLLPNLLIYPYAYADIKKQPVEQYLPEEYWTALKAYKIREDEGSLRNRKYVSALEPYRIYRQCIENHSIAADYTPSKDPEKTYRELAGFYQGPVRDAILFKVIFEAIITKNDFATIKKLKRDYQKKYNLKKEYLQTLEKMMK